MLSKDKYRLLVVLSFIILVITLGILFIQLWNNFSLDPDLNINNIVYLYLLIILASALVLFLINIFQFNEIQSAEIDQDIAGKEDEDKDNIQPSDQLYNSFFAPLNIMN